MVMRLSDKHPRQTQDGFLICVMEHSPGLMVVEVALDKGTCLAAHRHVQEQITYVVRGSVQFCMDNGEAIVLAAGESCRFGPNERHGVEALSDAMVVDAFSPAREDLL